MRFTVFLPVKNGGVLLKECVTSILNQTYCDFDLVVLDNASADGSVEWMRSLSDSRIVILESSVPLSIEDNWARVMNIKKNEYMTIIGHDDLLDPSYMEIMRQLIKEHPDAGIYQAHFRLIDGAGRPIRSCMPMPTIESVENFLKERFRFRRDSFVAGYMFRSADYEKVAGIPQYKKLLFADDALWVKLMMNSYKVTASDVCFSYRVHAQSTSYAPDWRSTYIALGCYLDFLEFCGRQKREIESVLHDYLADYMIFWFQWAYFSTDKNSEERKAAEAEINRLIAHVGRILHISSREKFILNVGKYVFNNFAYCHWISRRCRKWFYGRFPYF